MNAKAKVFCIGFNKTGTCSLNAFFKEIGLVSVHHTIWPIWSHQGNMSPFDKADCFSDGECANFYKLQSHFPDSVFLLNTRNLRDWLRSRVKHAMRHGHPKDFGDNPPDYWGVMDSEFFTDEWLAIDSWILKRELYHKEAKAYFHGDPKFKVIDVTAENDWASKLGHFLEENNFDIQSDKIRSFHRNKRPTTKIVDQACLNKYLSLVDERLDVMGKTYSLS